MTTSLILGTHCQELGEGNRNVSGNVAAARLTDDESITDEPIMVLRDERENR